MLITLDQLIVNEFAAVQRGSDGDLSHPLGPGFEPTEADPTALSNLLTVVMRREARMDYQFRRLFMKIIQAGHFDVLREANYEDTEIPGLNEFFISVVAAVNLPEEVKADAFQRKRKREGTSEPNQSPKKEVKREVKAEVKKEVKPEPADLSFPSAMMKEAKTDPSETDEDFGSDFDSDFDANVELVKNLRPNRLLRPKTTRTPLSDAEFERLLLGPSA